MDQCDSDFRLSVRTWLAANCPAGTRGGFVADRDNFWGGRSPVYKHPDQRVWLERMVAQGWTVPGWPREYGGAGLTLEEQVVLREEMARIGAWSPLDSFGITMLGPVLLAFGSDAQKRQHLPPIARGEIRWCQGFSEPGAGSDLASLRTRAEDAGDHWLVNGQKVWTSYADRCDWIFCLVRTDPSAKKQRGISFLLIDMQSPGVTTRPIKLISGESPFCETFFVDVRVPKTNLVGDLHRGWDLAKYLLVHEREAIGRGASGLVDLSALLPVAQRRAGLDGGAIGQRALATDVVRAEIDARAYDVTVRRYREQVAASGSALGDRASILKYCGAALNKRHAELMLQLEGAEALERADERQLEAAPARRWLRSRGNSIEGGTSEIMLDIIARRLLDLPSQ